MDYNQVKEHIKNKEEIKDFETIEKKYVKRNCEI